MFNTVLVSGTSGAAQTVNWVDKTWMITEGTVDGSNVNMSVQWNASNELPSFTRPNCGITHFDSGFGLWDTPTNISATTGAGPYQQFRNNLTSFSPFSVINGAVILPIELTKFTGENKNQNNLLT